MMKYLVLILAILQPITSYLATTGNARFMDEGSGPLISPAGYAFAIWGVITTGSLLYAIYQALPRRRNAELYRKIAPYAAGVFAGFSLWLYAANQEWLWVTVLIFVGMGYFLSRLYPHLLQAVAAKKLSLLELVIVYGTFGLYAGWTTVAIFANIAAAVKFSGIADTGTIGLIWQAVILAAAAVTAVVLLIRTKGSTPYGAAMLWGFVAIVIGVLTKSPEAVPLAVLAGIASASLVAAYLYTKRR